MKERLIKLWDDISAQSFTEENKTTEESPDNDKDFQDFMNSVQSSWSKAKSLDPRRLKWIWTFHSIFLKILKEDIEAL
jgi:hypothetical protein